MPLDSYHKAIIWKEGSTNLSDRDQCDRWFFTFPKHQTSSWIIGHCHPVLSAASHANFPDTPGLRSSVSATYWPLSSWNGLPSSELGALQNLLAFKLANLDFKPNDKTVDGPQLLSRWRCLLFLSLFSTLQKEFLTEYKSIHHSPME